MTQKENKYKVKDAAKDLNMSAGDIVDMVKELAGTERKPAGSLTESELNLVLEKVSQSNQVKDFEAYFAATEKKSSDSKIVSVVFASGFPPFWCDFLKIFPITLIQIGNFNNMANPPFFFGWQFSVILIQFD